MRDLCCPTGAILGMGGTTAYFSGATDPSSIFGFLMRPSWGGSGYSSSSASNNEIDSLYKLVDLLTNLDCDAASGKEQVGQKPCLHPGFPPCQQAVAEVSRSCCITYHSAHKIVYLLVYSDLFGAHIRTV